MRGPGDMQHGVHAHVSESSHAVHAPARRERGAMDEKVDANICVRCPGLAAPALLPTPIRPQHTDVYRLYACGRPLGPDCIGHRMDTYVHPTPACAVLIQKTGAAEAATHATGSSISVHAHAILPIPPDPSAPRDHCHQHPQVGVQPQRRGAHKRPERPEDLATPRARARTCAHREWGARRASRTPRLCAKNGHERSLGA